MEVKFSQKAEKKFKELEKQKQQRIISKLEEAKKYPKHHLKSLTGTTAYSLRAGDLRVIIDWKEEDKLFILTLGHRKNIYDRTNL